jgi:hypothetical protein
MNSPIQKILLALITAVLSASILASTASAELTFCTPGSGAGQCDEPQGVATDFETGRVYVAERGNNRVSVFEADGDFLFAFGWGVDTGAAELQKCTTASSCQAGIEGSGAGQFTRPSQIAVDNVAGSASRHDIYVGTDSGRVQRFDSSGAFALAWGWGVDTGAAKLETCTSASGCQSAPVIGGDSIVNAGECQISRPNDSIAVGPGGSVFVADATKIGPKESEGFNSRVQEFSPAGACLKESKLFGPTAEFKTQRVQDLAVDAAKDAYVKVEGAGGPLRKFDLASNETLLCSDSDLGTQALAIDDSGHLFASQGEQRVLHPSLSAFRVITEYDSSCKPLHRSGYGQIENSLRGLAAFHSAAGDLFGNEESGGLVRYLKIPPPGPIAAPPSVEASPLGNTKATLKAEINPEGKATSYHFEYLTQADYEAQEEGFPADPFEGPATKSTPTTALDFSAGKELRLRPAEAAIGCPVATEEALEEGKCLTPETEYRFRVVATNADNPAGAGAGTVEGAFTTKAGLEIGAVYASEVSTDAATLSAEVNPLGIQASGYFEYVDEATFQLSGFAEAAQIPDVAGGQSLLDFGTAETLATHSVSPFGLDPGTTYRYRLVASDPLLAEPIVSEAKSFTTFAPEAPTPGECPANEAFRSGASALLPDCRAYELVSPLDKENGDIVVIGGSSAPAVPKQSSVSGTRLAYGSYRSFGDAKSAPNTSQYIAARGEDGWQTHGITPQGGAPIGKGATFAAEFKVFSPDLCQGWLTPFSDVPLAEGEVPHYLNIYRREDQLCGKENYEALTTAQPENVSGAATGYGLALQGLSADGRVAAIAARDSLQGSGAPPQPACSSDGNGCKVQLYARAPGKGPTFVCVLPGGVPTGADCSAGTDLGFPGDSGTIQSASLANAVSADGKRIFWSNAITTDGKIYLRENPLGEGSECAETGAPCTVAVSAGGEALSGATSSHFWAAARDGSVALYTAGPVSANGDLYEFEVEGAVTKLIAGGVGGVLGASEDARRVYFTSTEVKAAGAVAGKPNLYFHEAGQGSGSYRFIGVLSSVDADPFQILSNSAVARQPRAHSGRVSPDGVHAAFMSSMPLTGYDNADAENGKADAEVFIYDAAANGGAGKLRCVSCNPSGARPAGGYLAGSQIPLWAAARLPTYQRSLYPGRLLADDGSRLFFESQDTLVPRDTNGRLDVYQWEELGAGGCEEADATYAPDSGGCISLISSGKALTDSTFVDASPSGDDVFIATLASLLPEDYGLTDIYDARVGGGFPPPPAPPTPCLGDACQSPVSPPSDPTPASASFRGPGDPTPGSKPRKPGCPQGKRRVRVKGGKSRCAPKRKRAQRKSQDRRIAR